MTGATIATSPEQRADRLRVAVIAAVTPTNEPLLRTLTETCDVQDVLTVEPPPARVRLRALLRSPEGFAVVTLARSVVLLFVDRVVTRRVGRLMAAEPPVPFHAERIPLSDVTGGALAERLAETRPDLLFLSGAPVVPEAVFAQPRRGTVNLHWGLSRCYRGNHTLFFPLFHRRYDALGVTLHYVDHGIDTGKIIAERQLAVDPADTLPVVFAKAAEAAAHLVGEFVRALERGAEDQPVHAGRGVLIRSRDRRVWHYVHYAAGRRWP